MSQSNDNQIKKQQDDFPLRKDNFLLVVDQKERYYHIYQKLNLGIAYLNYKQEFIDINQKFSDLLGYDLPELQQKRILNITHQDNQESILDRWEQLIALEISDFTLQKDCIKKDGSLISLEIAASLVAND